MQVCKLAPITKHKTMTQDTQNKFAAILAAAQAKAGNKTIPNFVPSEPQKEPEIKVIPEIEQLPEMSTMIFSDLMPEVLPEPKQTQVKFTIVDYSDKSFAVIGDTYPLRNQLSKLGGRFNYNLTCGKGWIFSKTKLQNVKDHFAI